MAKRGPGRPQSARVAGIALDIFNGHVPPGPSLVPSSKKRTRETGDESLPAKKRPVTRSVQEAAETRRSTRLRHPRITTLQQRQSGDAEQKHFQTYEVPPDDPPHTSRTRGAAKRAAKAGSREDEDNMASSVQEGEEVAANPPMTSPSANTRNRAKKGGMVGQTQDREGPVVDIQPIKRRQRPQRVLINGTKTRSSVLPKPQPVPSEVMQRPLALGHDLGEQAASGGENVIQGAEPFTNDVPQDQGDRTSSEESANTTETGSTDGQHLEMVHVTSIEESLEEAFSLYGCEKIWDTLLKAARESLDNDDRANQAPEIKALVSLVKKARTAYHAIKSRDEGTTEDEGSKIGEHLTNIKGRIRTIRPRQSTKNDSRLVNDVYVQGIPRMIKLLEVALVTRSLDGELSMASLKELVMIIDATRSLCDKACRWQPRPTLKHGVKQRTRTKILPSLEALRAAYTQGQYERLDEEEERAQEAEEAEKAARRQALADHVARFLAEEEKGMRAEHNSRAITYDGHGSQANSATPVLDIDDLGLDDTTPRAAANGTRRRLPWRETGVAAARQAPPSMLSQASGTGDAARPSREPTEDIPGPMASDWSKVEDRALLHGLEIFTGADRYLEIDRVFGSSGGPLNGRDVDELMQRSSFIKQSLASHVDEQRQRGGNVDHWAFLLSVEG